MRLLRFQLLLFCSLLIVIIGSLGGTCSTVQAQISSSHWKLVDTSFRKIGIPQFYAEPWAIYFLTPSIGFAYRKEKQFVATDVADWNFSFKSDSACIYRTNDSGKSWHRLDVGTMRGSIGQIYFVSKTHGYAAAMTNNAPPYDSSMIPGAGIYETTNQGDSWRKISSGEYGFYGVYAEGQSVFGTPGFTFNKKGKYITKGIYISRDAGKSWKWDDLPIAQYDLFITGNKQGHLVAQVRSEMNAQQCAYSDDTGHTWQMPVNSQLMQSAEVPELFMFPHTQFVYTLVDKNSLGPAQSKVLISTNGGRNWDINFIHSDPVYGFNNQIDGAGCALYAQSLQYSTINDLSTYRSTDYGVTWKSVGGIPGTGGEQQELSVVGRGAVVYEIDYNNNLYRTTDGGDGTLDASMIRETDLGQYHTDGLRGEKLSGNRLLRDTLTMTLCDSAQVQLPVAYKACDYATLDSLAVITDTAGTAAVLTAAEWSALLHHRILTETEPDTAQITFRPLRAGEYDLQLRLWFEREDYELEDTILPLHLHVLDAPAKLTVTPTDTLDFGSQSLCAAKRLTKTVAVRNTGCEPLAIDRVEFRPLGSTGGTSGSGDYRFTDSTGITVDRSDKPHTVSLSYQPTVAAEERGILIVYTNVGNDTIPVVGAGVNDRAAVLVEPDTVRARACDSADYRLPIMNLSCRTMILDSITAAGPAPAPFRVSERLPIAFSSGVPGDVGLRFTPTVSGLDRELMTLHLRYLKANDTTVVDTVVELIGVAAKGPSAMEVSISSIDLGEVSRCGSMDTAIVIESTGCDTLLGITASLQQDHLTVSSPVSSSLRSGSSQEVQLHFDPTGLPVGAVEDTLIVTSDAGTSRIPIHVVISGSVGKVALSATKLDFGELVLGCQQKEEMLTLKNGDCASVTVDSVGGLRPPFMLQSILPLTLAQGSSSMLTLQCLGTDALGSAPLLPVYLYYHSNNNGSGGNGSGGKADSVLVTLTATLTEPLIVRMTLGTATDQEVHPGEEVKIPVSVGTNSFSPRPGAVVTLPSSHLRLQFNTDLLSPVAVQDEGGVDLAWAPISGTIQEQGIEVELPSLSLEPNTVTPLLRLTARAFVTDTAMTTVRIVEFTNRDTTGGTAGDTAHCQRLLLDTALAQVKVLESCSDTVLRQFMRRGSQSFTVLGIHPNPATATVTVDIARAEASSFPTAQTPISLSDRIIHYDLFDVLGHNIRQGIIAEEHTMLDLQALAAGRYYLRLTDGHSTTTQPLLIKR